MLFATGNSAPLFNELITNTQGYKRTQTLKKNFRKYTHTQTHSIEIGNHSQQMNK